MDTCIQYIKLGYVKAQTLVQEFYRWYWPNSAVSGSDEEEHWLVVKDPIVRKVRISKPLRDKVWSYYVGDNFRCKCPCCNHQNIDAFHFECGHVIAEAEGGPTHLHNLRPICRSCNASMGKEHMMQFMVRCGFDTAVMEALDEIAKEIVQPLDKKEQIYECKRVEKNIQIS